MESIITFINSNDEKAGIVIGITGGSCSGKTSLARNVCSIYPNDACILHMDNYYKDLSHIVEEDRLLSTNFDVPDAFDMDLFIDHLICLKNGNSVMTPKYDYYTATRIGHVLLESKRIVIVEGILLLQEK